MKRALAILLILCLFAGLISGCAQSPTPTETATPSATAAPTPSPTPAIEQTLNLSFATSNLYNDYDFLYPWTDVGLQNNLLWLTLIQADKDLKPAQPEIMSDWTVSEDGMTITMTMRDDLFWSDGTPITMDDVLWTFDRICQQSYWPYVYAALGYIEGQPEYAAGTASTITGISAAGNVLTIKLTAPYATFIDMMCQVAPLPKHIYENCDFGENAAFKTDPIWAEINVNSGPYVVTEHVDGSYYVLEPNSYYKGDAAKITKIVCTATDTPVTLAQTGAIDYMGTNSADDYAILKDLSDYSLDMVPIIYFRFLAFNFYDADGNDKGFVSDVRVRQALAYAVDWKTVVTGLYGDLAGFTQTGVRSDDENYAGDWYNYDPDMAKSLLDAAGYDYDHVIKIFYYYTDQTTVDLMDAIAYYLNQIGVQMEAVLTTNSVGDIYEGRTQDIAYFGLSAFNNLSWYQMYVRPTMEAMLHSTSVFQEGVNALQVAYTPELWKTAITNLQALEKENVFYIPVYTLSYQVWLNNRLSVPDDCFGNCWYFYDYQFENWEIVA